MDVNKQKLSELLRQKALWEKKKSRYFLQYHVWIDNAWLGAMALLGMITIGSKSLGEESFWSKLVGWICLVVATLLLYKVFKVCPCRRKIWVCERKIADIDCQIAKKLEELAIVEEFNQNLAQESKK